MIVMKFGGTSLEDADAIRRAARIVQGRLKRKPVVVVSAMAGVTDSLVLACSAAERGDLNTALNLVEKLRARHFATANKTTSGRELQSLTATFSELFDSFPEILKGIATLRELSPRSSDRILAFGEVLSSLLVSAAFSSMGVRACHVDSRNVIVTDDAHGSALPNFEYTAERLKQVMHPLIEEDWVPVMAGYIGANAQGITTTLGRGGSDFSAAIVGACLPSERIEIWTDVEGMQTTDPRICPESQRISAIGFEEAAELAFFGAKVLHPATIVPAIKRHIPIYVLNSRNFLSRGTRIQAEVPRCPTTFRAIAVKKGATVINVRAPRMLLAFSFLRTLFSIIEKHRCPVNLVSTSEVSVSVVVDSFRDYCGMISELGELGDVEVEPSKAIVCLVGNDIKGRIGIAASVFNVLADSKVNVHMISQGASEINIGVVIDEADVVTAVRSLHRHFFPAQGAAGAHRKPAKSAPPTQFQSLCSLEGTGQDWS